MEQDKDARLLFEIEGTPGKRLLKKTRNHIAVYADRIEINAHGKCDVYRRDTINDIFIIEPVVENIDCRTTAVDHLENGVMYRYELDDDIFPGLCQKMERVLDNEWSDVKEKYNYPETIKWFVACCSVHHLVNEKNPYIYGGEHKVPERVKCQRDSLRKWWDFKNRDDLLDMLRLLLDGRTMMQYKDSEENSALILNMERCFWAWDLQRMVLLGAEGYASEYLSWEESLDWSLIAGQKLQGLFQTWDDFMVNYLRGYSVWAEEDLDDEDTDAYERKHVYEHYKQMPRNPWSIPWDLPLTKEW